MQPQMSAAYELSPQQRLFFEQGRESAVAGLAISLQGQIEAGKVRGALQQLLTRHEILRTSFQRRTGMKFPFQVVQEPGTLSWEELALSTLDKAQQIARIQDFLRDSSQIDLEKGPVFHARLATLGADRHVLALTLSALCVDDVTLSRLFSEFQTLYTGAPAGEDALQYADYSEWQRETLRRDDDDARQAARFWQQFKIESIPALSLPFERNTATGPPGWETVAVATSASSYDETFLLACWQVFLWRMTGQQEFVLGYFSNGRNHEEFAGGAGVFAKTLPLLVNFENEPSFADFLNARRTAADQAMEWQDYFPADSIGSHVPVGFAFRSEVPKDYTNTPAISELARVLPLAAVRLQLRCVADAVALDFDPAYFAPEIVAQLAERFSILIAAAAADPSLVVGSLPVISEREKRKVVVEFNQTSAEYSSEKSVHEIFEEHAKQHPERPALRFGERELSYADLNREANRIAYVLRQSGVGSNVPVALCLERSAEMITALLGILKAGGCYVPLIPGNPKARLSHQLAETAAPVMLTGQTHLDGLPEFSGKVICLDRDRELLASVPDTNPQVEVSRENLAYVIYTSGSTGIPKGVAVRHFNLLNYSFFICRRLELEKHSQGLHFATVSTISADLGNTCIFPSLISGGCLHVIGYEMAMSPSLFADHASRHPIDVLKITPSHLASLLTSEAASSILPRKYLVLGGEATRWDLIERIRKAGSCAIFNHYGPTEATVGCCTFSVDQEDVSIWGPSSVPIGRPIANDQVYILGRHMEPLPVGVAGEICIGGTGLAQGYLNQPQQTVERFVPNPFSHDPEARLYRTGDLARFLPDGNLEFLGRIDQQVKIRGFRVEPAEIEAVMKRFPLVHQAAIVAYDDKAGEKRLAAYLVSGGKIRAEEVRAFLAQELPEYMLPSAFVQVDSLPLTANGKLDLRALPSPEDHPKDREMVAPRTQEEEKLVGMWREVLKLDHVGVTDNFFELGGHSLLATQIISRIRNTFRVQMPLQSFLQSPTIAGLAAQISQCPAIESEQEEMARLLAELEGISEEEAEKLLAAELEKDKG